LQVVDSHHTPAPAATATQPPVTINIQPGSDSESQIMKAVYRKVDPAVVEVVNLAQSVGMRGVRLGLIPQGEARDSCGISRDTLSPTTT